MATLGVSRGHRSRVERRIFIAMLVVIASAFIGGVIAILGNMYEFCLGETWKAIYYGGLTLTFLLVSIIHANASARRRRRRS